MIAEFTIAAALVYGVQYIKDPARKIKKKFNDVMACNNLQYKILKIITKDYGFDLIVVLGNQGYEKLESSKDMLQTSLGTSIYIQQNKNFSTATINAIGNIKDNIKFEPIQTKPYELYVSQSFKGEKLTSNLNKFPHVLVSGQTGCGKTEQIRIMLTNQICSHNSRDINLYFSDLSDTNDFSIFKKCEQTKVYAKNIKESLNLFNYLEHIYSKRLGIFEKHYCKNIVEYNKQQYEKRMPYIYLVLDEFADYYPVNRLVKDYTSKQRCYNMLRELVRKARKVGIFLIIGIQRPDTTVLDPSLRSGLCTKLGFSQNSNASSLTVCDTNELTNIENRQGLYMVGNRREWFKSLYITDKIIKKYIKNSTFKADNIKNVEVTDLVKVSNNPFSDDHKTITVKEYTEIKKLPKNKKSKRRVKL